MTSGTTLVTIVVVDKSIVLIQGAKEVGMDVEEAVDDVVEGVKASACASDTAINKTEQINCCNPEYMDKYY